MTRFNTLLLVILMASALYLVKASYDARNLYTALERARNEEQALELDYGRLELDKRAEATPLRIEKVAREKLDMRTATPAVTQYVTYAAATLASGETPAAKPPMTAASGAAAIRANAAADASAAASAAAFRSSQSAAIVAAAAAASQAASAAGKGGKSRGAATRQAARPAHSPAGKSSAATSPKA